MPKSASGAREVALDVLRRVSTQSAFASVALRAAFEANAHLSASDRGLATELVYGVLRRRGHIDRAIGALGKRLKDLDPRLHDVLRLGAYQILFLDRVPHHAAVNDAVDQAKARGGPRAGSQANAILRRLADTPPEARIPPPPDAKRDPIGHVAALGGLPFQIAEQAVQDLGFEEALAFALASLVPARLSLRVNRRVATREAIVTETGGEPGSVVWSVVLPVGGGLLPGNLSCVREGRATPQDEASMRVVELLGPESGERVLDVCAAPGGKTTHIAECMNDHGEIVAHDRLRHRLARVDEAALRLGLRCIRSVELLPALEDPPFDRVLVDAPCSGLGTLRRHPEIRWRFRLGDFESLERVQRAVLEEGARRVRLGGTLVYSVCTITKAEGESRIADLPGFELVDTLKTGPHQPGAPDGFFAARLIRRN